MNETEMKDAHEQFNHAYQAIGDAVRSMNEMRINPASMASALGAAYVRYIAALMALTGQPKEGVLNAAVDGIGSMGEFVDEVFDSAIKARDQLKDAA